MAAIRRDRTAGAGRTRRIIDILAVAAVFAFVAALTVGLGPRTGSSAPIPVATAAVN
jgi:hypothetical protein